MNLETNDRIKASKIVQDNANWAGEPRWMHMYNGVFWQSKTEPTQASPPATRFDPQERKMFRRTGHLIDLGDKLDDIVRAQSTWSDKTFGTPQERGPEGPLKHIKKEVDEALEKPRDILEYADIFLLALDATRRAGFTVMELLQASEQKQRLVETRTYEKPAADEVSEHVRGKHELEVVLQDSEDDAAGTLKVKIGYSENEIMIGPAGHGLASMNDDYPYVIAMELRHSEFRILVWGDINNEDVTECISLDAARLELRREE